MFSTDVACCCPPNWNWTRGFAREKDCLFEIGLLRCCSLQTANAPASDPRLGYSLRSSKEVWKLNFRQYGEMEKAQPGRNSDVEKVRREKIRDGEGKRWRKSEERRCRRAKKGREGAKHCVFQHSVSRLRRVKGRHAKAAGAETSRQMRDEQLHAVVARSTFGSKKCQSTSCSEHFWKLRCGKRVRRCGAKHMVNSKEAKHVGFGALLEVELWKKCTPLWRQAHFQVKM